MTADRGWMDPHPRIPADHPDQPSSRRPRDDVTEVERRREWLLDELPESVETGRDLGGLAVDDQLPDMDEGARPGHRAYLD